MTRIFRSKRQFLIAIVSLFTLASIISPVFSQSGRTDGMGNPLHLNVGIDRETGLVTWRPINGASWYVVRYRSCNSFTRDVLLNGGSHGSFQLPGYDPEVWFEVRVYGYGFFDGAWNPSTEARLIRGNTNSNGRFCDRSPDRPDYDDREEGEIRIPLDNPSLHPVSAPSVAPDPPSSQPVSPIPSENTASIPDQSGGTSLSGISNVELSGSLSGDGGPGTIQVPGDQYKPASGGLTVTLNNADGSVFWDSVAGATMYWVYWERCNQPKTQLQVFGFTNILIPNFVSSERYDVRVDAITVTGSEQKVIAWNYSSNNLHCSSQPAPGNIVEISVNLTPTDDDDNPTAQTLVPTIQLIRERAPREISWHAGTSLNVSTENGRITAIDVGRNKSLAVEGNCYPGQVLAYNDALVISCTADGRFHVLQVNPQHPGDRRRDLLVFNADLSDCFRAYEYLDTGVIEVFWRMC